MYAAAGGASLASRQKRKNQAALNVKNKALLQQGLKDKLAASRASGLATPTKATSRQFHNLPPSYLRTPQAQTRKLSGGYTTQSRLLLPINESNSNIDSQHHNYHLHQQQNQQLHHPTQQQQLNQQQHFQQQLQQQQSGLPHSPRCEHPPNHHSHHSHHHHHNHHHQPLHHSQSHHPAGAIGGSSTVTASSNFHGKCILPKSATCPLVSQSDATPPITPTTVTSGSKPSNDEPATITTTMATTSQPYSSIHIQVPHDSIIVTPATPLASPGQPAPSSSPTQFERKCSFYRGKKLTGGGGISSSCCYDDCLQQPNKTTTITYSDDQMLQYCDEYHTSYSVPNGGQKWADADYCDSEHRHIGICTCDHVEVNEIFLTHFDTFDFQD